MMDSKVLSTETEVVKSSDYPFTKFIYVCRHKGTVGELVKTMTDEHFVKNLFPSQDNSRANSAPLLSLVFGTIGQYS